MHRFPTLKRPAGKPNTDEFKPDPTRGTRYPQIEETQHMGPPKVT